LIGSKPTTKEVIMPRLTDQEQQEIIRYLEADKPLPEVGCQYRMSIEDTKPFMLPAIRRRISVHKPQAIETRVVPADAAGCRKSQCIR
jgi:hypothetical protein